MNPALRTTRPIIGFEERACEDCHARKVKCDGALNGFPCRNCKLAKIHCTVPERRKRRSRVIDQSSEQRGKKLKTPVSTQAIVPTETEPIFLDSSPEEHGKEKSQAIISDGAADAEFARQHLVEFFSQNLQDKPIQTRLTYIGSELSTLNYLVRQQSINQRVHHYPSSNSYAPRIPRQLQGAPSPSLIPKDAFVLPPRSISDALIGAYFEHIHGIFPIIDRERFLSQYEAPTSTTPLLLLHTICLAGSHVTSTLENPQELKRALFRRAKSLFDGRYEEDRMHMVQAALLLTWFSDGGDDVCANAWWWIGVAARIALGLGMHRDVGPSKMVEHDKRTWRKIWWCLVQFDVLVSLCYGRPQNM
ncbi:transcriptional regulatory amdr [Trichoderma arundinaceum]|uniref:Transcriptional regulatory amdr n=1 Tax=Trichoderma arundinaceum TaxID=490622 RepID=A0A395NZZ5_TRIAR|nr:transcriptional regulatory amdr [Trichoderma arundinaceum]